MPKKVIFKEEKYNELHEFLTKLGFRVMKDSDWLFAQATKNLKPPRKQEGEEIAYCYDANGYRVVVQTTFNNQTKEVFRSDSGWILIIDVVTGNRLWSSYPLHRTDGFLNRLMKFAEIAQVQADNRPVCSCKKPMNLVPGTRFKERTWICSNHEKHVLSAPGRGFFENIQHRKDLFEFLKNFFEKKERYHKILTEQGIPIGRAYNKRKIW